ncbi:MAG: type II secretion system F family protein [Chloroflexi bacterium]|nr:type II secretion system F family protein [Chloroflexota bacterium]
MTIEYVAYNTSGDIVTGVLEAESTSKAQETLWASNLVILSLKKRLRVPSLGELMPTFFGLKAMDIITFTRELASLLQSGIALVPSLTVLHEQTEKPMLKAAIRSVIRDLEVGKPFSEACANLPSVFPAFYVRLLKIAEETGELAEILIQISVFMERKRAATAKVRKALAYPTIVLIVGMVAAGILIVFALPSMTKLLAEYGAKLPLTTRILMKLGDIGSAYGIYILAFLVSFFLLAWRYIRTSSGKKRWDHALLKVPLFGKIVRNSEMSRLCSSLATMLSGGIPIAEAIRLSGQAIDNTVFQNGVSEVYREILTGSRLEPAVTRQRIFPRLFAQTVRIGEEAGSLQKNLVGLSAYYEQETDRAISRATDLIEPSIIVISGAMVGLVGSAIVSAIYGIIPQIR